MVALLTMFIAPAGFTLRGAPGTSEIFTKCSCQIWVKAKKVLPSERGAPGAVLYGKSAFGYCITFMKWLDVGQR